MGVAEIYLFERTAHACGLASELPFLFITREKVADRFFGFFTANIRNRNTRRAYYKAAC